MATNGTEVIDYVIGYEWYHGRTVQPGEYDQNYLTKLAVQNGFDFGRSAHATLIYYYQLGIIPKRIHIERSRKRLWWPPETLWCLIQIQRHIYRGVKPSVLASLAEAI